jgi:hypothetical protein
MDAAPRGVQHAIGWPLAAALGALVLALIGATLSDAHGIARTVMFRDPASEFGTPYFAGLFSNLGVASLCATAAVVGMTVIVDPRARVIGSLVAMLSLGLAADDLLLIHEGWAGRHLGVPESVFFVTYAGLGCAILILVLRTAREQALGLILAGALLAASIVVDMGWLPPRFSSNLVEDTLKFMGLLGWFAFWVQFCVLLLIDRRP